MSNVLVINSHQSEVEIALLENKQLVELQKEGGAGRRFSVGDVFLGKVKKLVPGLNAAFVDVGARKDAFLHYFDLGPQANSMNKWSKLVHTGKFTVPWLKNFRQEKDIDKGGKINQVLSEGQFITVQITKEPISTKGPRITSEITLAGRYLVLVPFSDKISISQRIKNSKDKERLKRLLNSIKSENFGVIIRTAAENVKAAELDADLKSLMKKWEQIFKNLKNAKPPKKILGELDRTAVFLRDMINDSYSSIHVNDTKLCGEIQDYLKTIAPAKAKIVKLYRGEIPIFDHYDVTKQKKAMFGKHATMPSGAYLVVEHTEALHVIDVNSGRTSSSEDDQETNALNVNLEAVSEVARQLRVRDMGGIIVVDFIDMRSAENRKKVYNKMKDVMASDKAKHTILPLSRFGLIQITRQRVRPEMEVDTTEKCPSCNGTGEAQASILLVDEIESMLKKIMKKQKPSSVILCVHPFIAAYLRKGYPSVQAKWFFTFRKRIRIREFEDFAMLEYKFFTGKGEELEV
ncbi:MAG: ribonuclease E/G [Flavobacteriales bacterium]|nr:MAG: ribonuclease E/G [Flavobacteriales bacterium]